MAGQMWERWRRSHQCDAVLPSPLARYGALLFIGSSSALMVFDFGTQILQLNASSSAYSASQGVRDYPRRRAQQGYGTALSMGIRCFQRQPQAVV